MEEKKILRSVADSVTRLRDAKTEVAANVNTSPVRKQMDRLSKPGSPSSAMKKAGVALIIGTPDPITAIPGVALIASSFIAKRKDPSKLDDLAAETRKILRDMQSLRL
jgi:hypothetical protein